MWTCLSLLLNLARAQEAPPAAPVAEAEAAPTEAAPTEAAAAPAEVVATAPGAPPAEPLTDALARWQDSVVMLVTGPAWCSGVLIDDKGTVATAYHCVASGNRPEVTLRDGRSAIGRTVAARPREDLALVVVPELAGAPALQLRADEPRQGERVYGLGHPYAPYADRTREMQGMLLWSVSEGIVSAVGPHLLQTDAALNPGNSGGPVVDAEGRVVGITSRKIGGDNLAFASRSTQLAALVADPRPLTWWGGAAVLGVSLITGLALDSATVVELRGGAVLRDHAVFLLGYGLPLDARDRAVELGQVTYPSWEATAGARQRFGRGRWSSAIEAGGGVAGLATTSAGVQGDGTWYVTPGLGGMGPSAYGRVETGSLGVRVASVWLDGEPWWMFGLDFEAPGTLAHF